MPDPGCQMPDGILVLGPDFEEEDDCGTASLPSSAVTSAPGNASSRQSKIAGEACIIQ